MHTEKDFIEHVNDADGLGVQDNRFKEPWEFGGLRRRNERTLLGRVDGSFKQ
jgi:hypothetical protein